MRLTGVVLPQAGLVPLNRDARRGPLAPCRKCGGRIMQDGFLFGKPDLVCINCGWRPKVRRTR